MRPTCARLNPRVKRPAVVSERETSTARKARKGEKETRSVKSAVRNGFYFGAGRYSGGFRKRVSERASDQSGRERTEWMDERASEWHNTRYPSRTDTGPRTRSKANIHEMTRRRRGSARVALPPSLPSSVPFPRDEERTREDSKVREWQKMRGEVGEKGEGRVGR